MNATEITTMMDVRRNLISIRNICWGELEEVWADCRKYYKSEEKEMISGECKRKYIVALNASAEWFNNLEGSGELYPAYKKDLEKIKSMVSALHKLLTLPEEVEAQVVARFVMKIFDGFRDMYFILSGEEISLSTPENFVRHPRYKRGEV